MKGLHVDVQLVAVLFLFTTSFLVLLVLMSAPDRIIELFVTWTTALFGALLALLKGGTSKPPDGQ